MQLAHQKMLPEVLAAVVRAMSAARSLVAFEHGAVGPSKDCAYEGPMIKAITGCPIAMEGKSATCAHFSPLGNIASAMCDLWSNESVQNVRLLSGNAPEAYAETLAYDCRLMNVATARNQALILRDWLTESDEWLSPQAAILSPRAACRIAEAIVSAPDTYRRTVAAGQTAVAILREGLAAGRLKLAPKERNWLDRIEKELQSSPASAENFWARCRRPMASSSWRQAMACKRKTRSDSLEPVTCRVHRACEDAPRNRPSCRACRLDLIPHLTLFGMPEVQNKLSFAPTMRVPQRMVNSV